MPDDAAKATVSTDETKNINHKTQENISKDFFRLGGSARAEPRITPL